MTSPNWTPESALAGGLGIPIGAGEGKVLGDTVSPMVTDVMAGNAAGVVIGDTTGMVLIGTKSSWTGEISTGDSTGDTVILRASRLGTSGESVLLTMGAGTNFTRVVFMVVTVVLSSAIALQSKVIWMDTLKNKKEVDLRAV
jgi:hypothetical protein